jgi:prepilin-type N-terminal cleavage/methylation domain-containing protein
MSGICKNGFSFLELVVAIFLLSLMATIVVPNLKDMIPGYKQKAFISDFTALILLTWQQTITTGKQHRIYFDFDVNRIEAQVEKQKGGEENKSSYQAVVVPYSRSSIEWPDFLQPKEFYVNGEDELKKVKGEAKKMWFYLYPEGHAQAIIINAQNKQDQKNVMSLVLNPFTLQIKTYDTFQKPA